MAMTEVPPELEDLSLRERRRRFEQRNGTASDVELELEEIPASACSVCGGPLRSSRAKTCARAECIREARRRRARTWPSTRNGHVSTVDAGGAHTRECISLPPEDALPAPRDPFGPVVAALAVAGAVVVRAEPVEYVVTIRLPATTNGGA